MPILNQPPVVLLRDRILDALGKAQEKRNDLQGRVESEHDHFPIERWVLHEREVMFDMVARERAMLGKGPIPITEVVKVERMAQGHSDYSSKYALYCAELVLK